MLSLVFWSLVLVVVLKYLVFVMRADNRGEGGIMALIALHLAGAGRRRPPGDAAAGSSSSACSAPRSCSPTA